MTFLYRLPFEIDSIPENIGMIFFLSNNVDNTDIYEEINKNSNKEELKSNEMSVNDTLKNSIPLEDQKKLRKMLKYRFIHPFIYKYLEKLE